MIKRDHPIFDAAEVVPRLWIGSHPPVRGHRCGDHPVEYNADLAQDGGFSFLALCAEEYQPAPENFPGVEVCHAPFDDNYHGISAREQQIAFDAAKRTAAAFKRGKTCLVTCMAGRNRSGLVCALALSQLVGVHAVRAGEVVRERRGLGALTNMSFRGILARAGSSPLSGSASEAKGVCELCEAAPVTRRYHEDAICWIADCKQCGVPMAVYRAHGIMPPAPHLAHMFELLRMCGKPGRAYKIDASMETIPSHYHAHLRPQ